MQFLIRKNCGEIGLTPCRLVLACRVGMRARTRYTFRVRVKVGVQNKVILAGIRYTFRVGVEVGGTTRCHLGADATVARALPTAIYCITPPTAVAILYFERKKPPFFSLGVAERLRHGDLQEPQQHGRRPSR